MSKTTINDAIQLLEAAKKEFGGECPFICFNRHGDVVRPSSCDIRIGIKGNEEFKEIYLT